TALAQNGPLFSAQSDFSFGYQPIDGNYPAGSPGTYAVATGDTLQSIARGAYGDSSLWYLIADANGLSSDADLRTGQVLRIPTKVGSADNASTFRPYDPSKIASDSATMMATPQAEDGGCGAVGQIIMVVVAVVAAVFTAGAALAAMGATLATAGTGTLIAAGAIGGAVGSIASQAVGIAIGAQDSFSWKGVALGAIGGGVTAGLGGAGLLPDTGNVFLNGAIRGAVSSTLTQGIAVVTGLQDKFSWKSVAASAVGAGVGAAAGPAIGKAFGEAFGNNAGSAFAARLATGLVAGTAAAVMRGGKVAIQQVATDAFGNALGDSIAAANGQSSGSSGGQGDNELDALFRQNNNWAGVSAMPSNQEPDFSWITAGNAPVNPYANLSMAGGVQLAAGPGYSGGVDSNRLSLDMLNPNDQVPAGGSLRGMTNEELLARGNALLASGNSSMPLGGPVVDTGITLREITVNAPAEDDGSYDASEAARLSNYPAPNGAYAGTITNLPPTFWERTWLSSEVQHVMGNSITGKIVGGLAHAGGTAWASFASPNGYNPATGKNLNLVQQRDGRIDTLINAASTVLTGGASTATRMEMQAVKSEALATGRMAELQAKWEGLSATERRTLLESKSEATWSDWLAQRDAQAKAVNPNTHFMEKHGPGTTLEAQETRATTRVAPDNSIDLAYRDSTRFMSSRDMGAAMQRADSIFMLNGGVNKAYPFSMEGIIGEGYKKAPNSNWMFTTNVNAVYRNGQPYTMFPLLRSVP
ncbi:LysM peptidoglycan-binding domain-containing protein, partial [Variovorax sp. OV700]|uniref:LysM peptidoglycan-binding domain-containing protein n=1 Tax=Variovorax sp. OV700 TaxID=1882826 RepID=UPI00088D42D9